MKTLLPSLIAALMFVANIVVLNIGHSVFIEDIHDLKAERESWRQSLLRELELVKAGDVQHHNDPNLHMPLDEKLTFFITRQEFENWLKHLPAE